MPLSPGSRLGAYEVVGQLGAGGMGEVYRARDTRLGRDVALKVLPAEFALDPERLARFMREAQVLASLNHPGIAAIYGIEDHALVLELVDGPTLADRIAQGRIDLEEALPIARQIAEALEAAHEQGIIHRDLKPANIKVRPDGTVKVLDFGLAKLIESDSDLRGVGPNNSVRAQTLSPTITTPAVTMAGVILGTAAYMSPEQAKGRAADKRSDIWAFGCVLFEMLTGTRPFDGDDVSDTLAAVLRADPGWSALPADTPPRIRTLLERCLQKDVKKRLPHIAIARFDIDEVPAAPMAAATAVPFVKQSMARRAVPVAIGAAVAAAITSGIWWTREAASTSPIVTRFAISLPQGRLFGGAGRRVLDISPDGSQWVYVANRQLYRHTMGEFDDTPISGSENSTGITTPVFSPDGRWIAFLAGSVEGPAIAKVPSSGGVTQRLTTLSGATPGNGMDWDASGIIFTHGQSIQRVSSNGGTPEMLVSLKDGESPAEPRMLPGGHDVMYTRRYIGGSDDASSDIVVHSLKSGTDKTLIKNGADARFLESGHLVYAASGVLFAVPFDLKQMEITGEPVMVLSGIRRGGGIGRAAGAAQYSVSRAGSLIYLPGPASVAEAQQDIALIDRSGRIEPLKWPPGAYEAPRVSPNGKQIAASSVNAKEAAVWLYDLSGTTAPRRLTFGGRNRFPIWSGDGQRVAFQSDREGDLAVFVQRADGNGPAERLTQPAKGASHVPDSWSPDGKYLLFSETKGDEISSWIVSLNDKKISPFGEIRAQLPINALFSPDGKWVVYQSGRAGDNGVFVQPFPATAGAKYQISKGSAAHHPAWSRDGKEIIYIPAQANAVVVSVAAQSGFDVGKATRELPAKGIEGGPASIRNYDVMPDGRLLGVVNADAGAAGVTETLEVRVVLNWFTELQQRVPTR